MCFRLILRPEFEALVYPGKVFTLDDNKRKQQEQFLNKIDASRGAVDLFEQLPDVFFFMKDKDGVFMKGNKALLDKMRLESEKELIGKTDYDISPRELADNFCEER